MKTLYCNRAPELRLTHHVTVRLNSYDSDRLNRLTKKLSLPSTEVIRMAIQHFDASVKESIEAGVMEKEKGGTIISATLEGEALRAYTEFRQEIRERRVREKEGK